MTTANAPQSDLTDALGHFWGDSLAEADPEVFAAVRNELVASLQAGGMSPEQASCIADRVLLELPLDQLDDPEAVDFAELQQQVIDATLACS